jgi:hypothetical protein
VREDGVGWMTAGRRKRNVHSEKGRQSSMREDPVATWGVDDAAGLQALTFCCPQICPHLFARIRGPHPGLPPPGGRPARVCVHRISAGTTKTHEQRDMPGQESAHPKDTQDSAGATLRACRGVMLTRLRLGAGLEPAPTSAPR